MKQTGDILKNTAKRVVQGYARHVKAEVSVNNQLYINSGIDNTYDLYEELFIVSAEKAFCLPTQTAITTSYDEALLTDTVSCIATLLDKEPDVQRDNYTLRCVLDICLLVLRKARDDDFQTVEM